MLDAADRVVFTHYARTGGRPWQATLAALRAMVAALGDAVATGVVVTGSGKELIAGPAGLATVSEIVAQATAAWTKHPDARSIIEIGGQDSKYIVVGRAPDGTPFLQDHAFNELCAAGTGAFLDQQAERLKLSIEAFGTLARDAARAARMAGRCSVFAKSDMIHLQQAAVPVDEIAAGLCRALARTYLAALCRGRAPSAPVLFQGGVARNPGVVRAFRELLGLGADGLIVPDGCELMGAFGAAVIAGERPLKTPMGLARLLATFAKREAPAPATADLKPLARRPTAAQTAAADPPARTPFVLGIDVGSVSTKGVVVDSGHARVRSSYRPTAGDPQAAIRQVIRELWAGLPGDCRVAHVVATGSGRHLARVLLGGGAVDEISAQAASAAFFFPQVDTVFEIGGQDAKFLRVKDGQVETFRMNRACAAGTGAFLEEQAARLGVRIAGEFSEAAFRSGAPAALGSRCTVFMDSDLVHHLQNGAHRDDLCAGLAYAVAQNYLEKVVGSAPVGRSVVFQGGVARNPAVHAGFEALLGRDILLHPCPELSGAMGAAMLALEELRQGWPAAAFSPERLRAAGTSETFECRRCENRCGITKIAVADQAPAHFGSVCGRFETADLEPPAGAGRVRGPRAAAARMPGRRPGPRAPRDDRSARDAHPERPPPLLGHVLPLAGLRGAPLAPDLPPDRRSRAAARAGGVLLPDQAALRACPRPARPGPAADLHPAPAHAHAPGRTRPPLRLPVHPGRPVRRPGERARRRRDRDAGIPRGRRERRLGRRRGRTARGRTRRGRRGLGGRARGRWPASRRPAGRRVAGSWRSWPAPAGAGPS